MERVRLPAVAGSFYPAAAEELKGLLQDCMVRSPLGPRGVKSFLPSLFGGMVPHAGYLYSGPCAAHFYAGLETDIRCVILLGVDHRATGARAALSVADCWKTPLGRVIVDRELYAWLESRLDFVEKDERPHRQEHSIEVQLPFLQTTLGDFTFAPIALSHLSEKECRELGEEIARAYETGNGAGKKTLVIASSDLSHYLSPRETEEIDRLALERVLAIDAPGLLKTVEEKEISMCGVIPTAVFLFAAKSLGAKQARLLKHCHSGDAIPMREVVGYASVAIEL